VGESRAASLITTGLGILVSVSVSPAQVTWTNIRSSGLDTGSMLSCGGFSSAMLPAARGETLWKWVSRKEVEQD
jgi:hypothetical protein